jgi:hypothetical protein
MHGACYADPDAQQSAWGVQAAEQQRLTLVDTRRYQPPARLLIRARSTRPTGCVASSRAIVMRAAFGRPPLWLILGTLLLLLSACETTGRGAELGKRQVSTITLTRADSGKVVETRAGQVLQRPETSLGGHATHLVGWDQRRGVFIGENSWGTTWGEDGYYRIAPEVIADPCSRDFWVITGGWEEVHR